MNKIDDRLTPEHDLKLQVVAAEQELDYFMRQTEEARKEAECWKRGVEAALAFIGETAAQGILSVIWENLGNQRIKRAIRPLELD